jgi:NAD(P)-dependent dehydrogenase (short-subunit alcohol dehydrogenase family)
MANTDKQRVAVLAPRSTIAQAVVKQLQEEGAQIACIGRSLEGIDVDQYAFAAECDLTDFNAVDEAVGQAQEACNGLTGLANFAGSMLLKPAHLTTRREYDDTLEANLATAFAAVRAAGKHMAKSSGSVVLISSAAGAYGMPNHECIAAAKGALESLARSAAATYAQRGMRFNVVAPGLVDTNLSQKIVSNEASRKVSESLHPLGRIGAADEAARAVCWLLHPQQSWITGQTLGVDGGLSRVQPRPKTAPAKQ